MATRQSECERKEEDWTNKIVKEVPPAAGINSSPPPPLLLQEFMGNYAKTVASPSAFPTGFTGH
jgi:hypothetical protein